MSVNSVDRDQQCGQGRDQKKAACLYVVATPIGNLGDISPRGVEVLQAVDYIAAEDTRHSGRLLGHFNITTPTIAYHDHSNVKRLEKIEELLRQGKSVALISDAGTPLISDPGYALVKSVRDQGIPVIPIPGACAMVAALSVAGLPSDRFVFEGFLPAKSSARQKRLSALAAEPRTLIFYESTHRLLDTLQDMIIAFGEARRGVMARELTKTFETVLSAPLGELRQRITADGNQQKGEFVLVVAGHKKPASESVLEPDVEQTMTVLLSELPIKQAAAIGAKLTGLKKRALYQWALERQSGST